MSFRHLSLLLLIALPTLAYGQTTPPAAASNPNFFTSTPEIWPSQRGKKDYDPIDVVTVSQPGVRHSCSVPTLTKDTIVSSRFARKPIIYQRDDVAALLLRPRHPDRNSLIASLVFTAACIASSFFVPSVGVAILLRAAAGLPYVIVISVALFTSALDDDGSDHNNDFLLYQKSGVPLTVTLHS